MLKTNYSLTKLLSFLFLFVFSISFGQEKAAIKEYSFTELFKMIEEETDTVFHLSNAQIIVDTLTDQQYIIDPQEFMDAYTVGRSNKIQLNKIIDKQLIFENINFKNNSGGNWFKSAMGIFINIHFKKKMTCTNVFGLRIFDSQFEDEVRFLWDKNFSKEDQQKSSFIINCHFNGSFRLSSRAEENINLEHELQFLLADNIFNQDKSEKTTLTYDSKILWNLTLVRNKFYGKGVFLLRSFEPESLEIRANIFENQTNISFLISDVIPMFLRISNNEFKKHVTFGITNPSPSMDIEWNQFKNKLFSENGKNFQSEEMMSGQSFEFWKDLDKLQLDIMYKDEYRIQNNEAYKAEMALRGEFFNYYKSRFDKESANLVYMELKDLETSRLKFNYTRAPSFDGYFKWKINQFLKVFSDYGTNPAKSIIFSIYVIFIFGAFYLFFPNSWDSHGKNRIMHRYSFFMKYMVKDAGIHEVYLEEKQQEFDEYREFGRVIDESKNKVPRFFTSTSILLLKWAKSGSVFSAFLLKRVDVMKGKWFELTKGKRIWKSTLLIIIFTLAVLYDVFIKMLNALMLSINTFTTLGFGEIPIRGLPRYLAIMQGFIGWFLLTIFSVSLISQLME